MPTPQPAKAILVMRRISIRKAAADYGCNHHYLGRILNGLLPPPRRMPAWMSGYLGVPEHELFRAPDSSAQARADVSADVAAAAAEVVARTTAAQGLPRQVADPVALERLGAILVRCGSGQQV